jgi:hypothetical protein
MVLSDSDDKNYRVSQIGQTVLNKKRNLKMTKNEKEMWEINIESAACAVAAEYDSAVVDSVFARYGATGLHNLASCYYSEVFADLEQIANDN